MLIEANIQLLQSLEKAILKFSDEEYNFPIPLLDGNSISKHIRHIVDFYTCLLISKEYLNYDNRKRENTIEKKVNLAIERLQEIQKLLYTLNLEKNLLLLHISKGVSTSIKTNMQRELLYNLEHCTHHMAMIKIAIKSSFPNVVLDAGFGLSESTETYQKNQN